MVKDEEKVVSFKKSLYIEELNNMVATLQQYPI